MPDLAASLPQREIAMKRLPLAAASCTLDKIFNGVPSNFVGAKKQFAKRAGLCREQMPGTLTFRVSQKHNCVSFQTMVSRLAQ